MGIVEGEIETRVPDVAAEALSRAFPDSGLRLADTADEFRFELRFRGDGTVHIADQRLDARLRVGIDRVDTVTVAWTTKGDVEYTSDRSSALAHTTVLWPGRSPLRADAEHAELHSVTIDRSVLLDRGAAVLGRDVPLPADLAAARSTGARIARRRLVSAAADVLDAAVAALPVLRAASLDLVVASTLVLFGLDLSATARGGSSKPVRRALAYMEEHVAEPITVADVATGAGVSVRSLQLLFQRELDAGPAAALRRLRLDRVRMDLLAGSPRTTSVAEVAGRWGIRHLGRLAGEYAERFGEQPVATLRR